MNISVCNYLPELLRDFVYPVGPRIGLYKRMPDKILIEVERVAGLRVKACQEHIDYKQNIDLRQALLLHSLGDIFSVRVKSLY